MAFASLHSTGQDVHVRYSAFQENPTQVTFSIFKLLCDTLPREGAAASVGRCASLSAVLVRNVRMQSDLDM